MVVAEVELDQAVAEQRMLDRGPEFPRALRLEIGIAAVDPLGRKVGEADEVVEVELGDRAPDRQLGVPAAARLPVERQVRLQELERAVRGRRRR